MRYVVIALAIAGCEGTPGRPAATGLLTRDDLSRACVNAYACIAPPTGGATIPNCLQHLDDGDTIVSIYRSAQIRCLVADGASCAAARACLGYAYGACSPDGKHCDGGRLTDCSGGFGTTFDCRNGLWCGGESTCIMALGRLRDRDVLRRHVRPLRWVARPASREQRAAGVRLCTAR